MECCAATIVGWRTVRSVPQPITDFAPELPAIWDQTTFRRHPDPAQDGIGRHIHLGGGSTAIAPTITGYAIREDALRQRPAARTITCLARRTPHSAASPGTADYAEMTRRRAVIARRMRTAKGTKASSSVDSAEVAAFVSRKMSRSFVPISMSPHGQFHEAGRAPTSCTPQGSAWAAWS
jgi:hypothetical protein